MVIESACLLIYAFSGPSECVHYLSVEKFFKFEEPVQYILNMNLYGVCSVILT